MRTLILLLAASAVSIASPSLAGSPTATPATMARPAAVQHYALLQRVQPLLATGPALRGASASMIVPIDAVGLSFDRVPDGWIAIGDITVESYGPHAATATSVAPVALNGASESAPAVPLTLALAVAGANPTSGHALVVDVALPSADRARLELLDVMGRRVAERDLGSLGTGRHSVDLGDGERFAPGVYLLRLTQGSEKRTARVTVLD